MIVKVQTPLGDWITIREFIPFHKQTAIICANQLLPWMDAIVVNKEGVIVFNGRKAKYSPLYYQDREIINGKAGDCMIYALRGYKLSCSLEGAINHR